MSEIITLSSDEEDKSPSPTKKRIKLISVPKSLSEIYAKVKESESCIILSDDDEVIDAKLSLKPKEKSSPTVECISIDNEPQKEDVSEPLPICLDNPSAVITDVPQYTLNNNLDISSASEPLSQNDEVQNALFAFLDDCAQAVTTPDHNRHVMMKLPTIRKLYDKLKKLVREMKDFDEVIKNNSEKIKNASERTVIFCFKDVYEWLKFSYRDALNARQSNETNDKLIKKLEKSLFEIRSKIKALENAEVNFDDEEDSTYLQVSQYKTRAIDIYKKLCKRRGENPNQGHPMYHRIDYSGSQISVINKSLNKKYKNYTVFPTYHDINKCLRQCVQENKLKLSEDEIKGEVKRCFEGIGRLVQKKRKLDLHHAHSSYIDNTKDPAGEDPEIDIKIRTHGSEAKKKLEEVYEKYVKLDEKGVKPNISSESDDSNVEVESDSEQDENATANV